MTTKKVKKKYNSVESKINIAMSGMGPRCTEEIVRTYNILYEPICIGRPETSVKPLSSSEMSEHVNCIQNNITNRLARELENEPLKWAEHLTKQAINEVFFMN